MNSLSGLLDGSKFSAEQPFVVLGWPSKSTVSAFASKAALWNYLEGGSRRDPKATFARAYEFDGSKWQRIPATPTYLTRRETHFQMECRPTS